MVIDHGIPYVLQDQIDVGFSKVPASLLSIEILRHAGLIFSLVFNCRKGTLELEHISIVHYMII